MQLGKVGMIGCAMNQKGKEIVIETVIVLVI